MIHIFIGSVVLSLVHAFIPNHWIPLVAIGKSNKWSRRDINLATFISGFSHTLSTVLIGILIGLTGYRLSKNFEIISTWVAPAILFILGSVFIITDFLSKKHHHHHSIKNTENRSKGAIITALSISMLFSPCLEIEAYFFQAGTYGWPGIIVLALTYTLLTVIAMLVLVNAAIKGVEKLKSNFIEKYNKSITGAILILIAIFSFFIEL